MQTSMCAAINTAMAQIDGRTSVVILKRLWDETSMRVQLDEQALDLMVGKQFAADVIACKRRGRKGKGSLYPGYVVQSFQQMAHLRWGRDEASAQEVFIPGKLIASSDADSIWNGMASSMPGFSVDRLRLIASKARVLAVHAFPDAHPSNRVVIQELIESIPNAVILQGHCIAHMAQLVWDTGSRKQMSNPLYQLVQLVAHSGTSGKVIKAMESTTADTDVLVGLAPSDTAFNDCVLEYTLRRPLQIGSFFTDPGAERHKPESYAEMVKDISQSCHDLQDGLTGNWSLPQCTHNCFGALPGSRCCPSTAAARAKARKSMKVLAVKSFASLGVVASNKWRSISQAIVKVSPALMIHGSMKKAFERTLATQAELQRMRAFIQAQADLIAGADLQGQPVVDANAFRVLRGKRVLGVHEWLQKEDSRFHVLSFLIGSVPIDKLFSTIFECEEYGMSLGRGDTDGPLKRGRIGFMQSLVSPTGISHQVHAMFADLIFSDASPFWKLLPFAAQHSLSKRRGVRVFRMMLLRLSAAFRARFQGTFWHDSFLLIRVLDMYLDEQVIWLRAFMNPGEEKCRKCEGLFITRLRAQLSAPPQLTEEEMLSVCTDVLDSLAEDPLVLSMHPVELLHAGTRSICARSMDRRKRLPVSVFTCQYLQRWRARHISSLNKHFCPARSVKKTIQKKKASSKVRQVSGHNVFTRDATDARHLLPCSCSFPQHPNYIGPLQKSCL